MKNRTGVDLYLPDGSPNFAYTPFGTKPMVELAYMGAALWSIILIAHVGLAVRYRTWYMAAAIVGCLLETLGYIIRIIAIQDPFTTAKYSSQQAFIILGPTLVAATQYVMLEKIIHFSYPSASPIKHYLITRIFVVSDVITFIVQCGGSAFLLLPTPTPAQIDLGTNILLAGIALQMVSFFAYLALAIVFYRRATTLEGKGDVHPSELSANWKRIFFTLMISGGAVCIRSVFRIIEFANGFSGPIATNENYMYVFDFGLMIIAMFAFVAVHPGTVLRHNASSVHVEMK
ncbi:RTA1-domain-containing protein [Rhizoclosmatium globosum]|uniref:RTA1-domain-containing protein n=1 Tax=Rhizoclosmatium globosum TaxID=329046 RepID=A0A1Y2B9J0_9FUNG|nr:RTA1-domain-containing protein [Rhizoclosmatium globosum]|eukprot:ORY31531.1 RTA1-domain-containing protein [Rhizoclosmatium globosum]